MDVKFSKPKTFGEILDHTFRLSKTYFVPFFFIFLIFFGPIYFLQAIFDMLSGTSFFREVGEGDMWLEQVFTSFDDTNVTDYSSNLVADIGFVLLGFISLIFYPIVGAAIFFAIDRIRKNETFTVGSVIKQAFSRFWQTFVSSVLYGFMAIVLMLVPVIMIILIAVLGLIIDPLFGVLSAIILFLGFAIGIGYLLTRWSFYFGSVVIDNKAPGIGRSWILTKGRGWILMGLYVVLLLIITCISIVIEVTLVFLLGNSVLYTLISNLVTMLTTMIYTVGFAVMFFDLKTRNDADDLKEMVEEYSEVHSLNGN
ncbi:hypothetical protein [Bacillus sp. FJAT-47783]|uniref:hypothetical protein n=1 Tax=Bacillus sp. FJAT-47783 TaxID=2922712 RepID=UPI001FADF58C|nr:hypothetical protein [Bacillus sp. FJAT-47783]